MTLQASLSSGRLRNLDMGTYHSDGNTPLSMVASSRRSLRARTHVVMQAPLPDRIMSPKHQELCIARPRACRYLPPTHTSNSRSRRRCCFLCRRARQLAVAPLNAFLSTCSSHQHQVTTGAEEGSTRYHDTHTHPHVDTLYGMHQDYKQHREALRRQAHKSHKG